MSHIFPTQIGLFQPILSTLQSVCQPRPVNRFEQVIDRIHLESFHGVLIIGSDKGNQRHTALPDQPNHSQTVQFRHLQVEQCQIRPLPLNNFHGLYSVFSFTDDLDVIERPQESSQKRPSWPFVICDHDSQFGIHSSENITDGFRT